MGEVTWSLCLELYRDLRNDDRGISHRIKNVEWVDFTDFFESIDPSKRKSDIHAVKTVMEKIGHLKGCSAAIFSPCRTLRISEQYEILRHVLGKVKIEELDFSLNSVRELQRDEIQRHGIIALIIKLIRLLAWQLDIPIYRIDRQTMTHFFGALEILRPLAELCETCEVKTLRLRHGRLKSEQLMEFVELAKDSMIVKMDIDNEPKISDDAKFELRNLLEKNEKKIEASLLEAVANVQVKNSPRHLYELSVDDSLIYSVSSRPQKGRALIINNEFLGRVIEGEDMVRMGSSKDFDNQVKLWTQMGFVITTKKDLGARGMKDTFTKFALDARGSSIIVVVVMTHGGKTSGGREYFQGDDRSVLPEEDIIYTQDVISMIDTTSLEGLPKVFLFQACRGIKRDLGVAADALGTNKVRSRLDMLIAYPCQTDHVSYRNEADGSWHMNAVTNVFMKHAHEIDVLGMMAMVNCAVSKKETAKGEVQVPRQESTLRKKLLLFPGWPT